MSKEKVMAGSFKFESEDRRKYITGLIEKIRDMEMREQELLIAQFIKQNPDYPIEGVCIVRELENDRCKFYLEPKDIDSLHDS